MLEIAILFGFGFFLVWLVLKTSNEIVGSRYFILGDDEMISMRYARNLASGVGLVWNKGVYIQGFTSFAWTLIMTLVHLLPVPDRLSSLPMQLTSVGFDLLTASYICRRVHERNGPGWGITAAVGYLASSCTVNWAISGWETSAVAFGWALSLDPVLDHRRQATHEWRSLAAAGMTVLFRPDAALLLGALALYWFLTADDTRRWTVFLVALLATIPAFSLTIFQHEYYGAWIPNTAVLKRSAGVLSIRPGIEYLLVSLFRFPFNVSVLLGAVVGARRLDRPSRILLGSLAVTYLTYVLSVGGDAFIHTRFLVPLLPTATVLAADCVSRIEFASETRRAFLARAAVALMIGLLAFDLADEALVVVPNEKGYNREQLNTALALRSLSAKKKPVVGLFVAGTVPYFNPDIEFADMLGKNDSHISRTKAHSGMPGHNRWDYDYSLDLLKPDLIITSEPISKQRPSKREVGFRNVENYLEDL
ncbi:MAG: hypothetical protein ACLQAT_07330 [Candidatus Binataceae bacterium]